LLPGYKPDTSGKNPGRISDNTSGNHPGNTSGRYPGKLLSNKSGNHPGNSSGRHPGNNQRRSALKSVLISGYKDEFK